ncbi:hypothetical protein GCM10011581_48620 [Saccharopolyspora subtropica]|uniref:Uncharacterized protein n=1 Tax=Saccharopolyspora thermophila TaxID=89367 RepID=A0A917K9M0_9PSEU|nr:hypothetical protein GCM10011581_48620 [Saccharopolyspora subtropica]
MHLAAYAIAAADGLLDPREQVLLGDWERYSVPTDGGAHAACLSTWASPPTTPACTRRTRSAASPQEPDSMRPGGAGQARLLPAPPAGDDPALVLLTAASDIAGQLHR